MPVGRELAPGRLAFFVDKTSIPSAAALLLAVSLFRVGQAEDGISGNLAAGARTIIAVRAPAFHSFMSEVAISARTWEHGKHGGERLRQAAKGRSDIETGLDSKHVQLNSTFGYFPLYVRSKTSRTIPATLRLDSLAAC
jgi:hypothetical protein